MASCRPGQERQFGKDGESGAFDQVIAPTQFAIVKLQTERKPCGEHGAGDEGDGHIQE
jgi:hypothetical protein